MSCAGPAPPLRAYDEAQNWSHVCVGMKNSTSKPSSYFFLPADTTTRGWRASLCCWKLVTTSDSALSLLWEHVCGLACVSRVHHGVHMACVWRSCNMYPRLGLVQAGSQGYLQMGTNRLSTAEAGIDLQIESHCRVSQTHGEVEHFSALELMPKLFPSRWKGSLKGTHARTHARTRS